MSGLTESANEVLKLAVSAFGSAFSYLAYAVGKANPAVTEEKPFCYTDGNGIYSAKSSCCFKLRRRGPNSRCWGCATRFSIACFFTRSEPSAKMRIFMTSRAI